MRAAVAVVAAVALTGCLIGPSVENQPGRFRWTIDADGVTDTWEYDWSNDGASARIAWDLSMATGTVTLEVADDAGARMATNTFEGGSSGDDLQTQSGRSGTWHLTIELQQVDGPVRMTVRSA